MSFRQILEVEIEQQKALIAKLDFPPNTSMHGNGIMTSIRLERLKLLEQLLEFEASPKPGDRE